MTADDYQSVLDRSGGKVEPLADAERARLMQEWRRLFAAALHDATGRWKLREFEWHVFSDGYARALNGEKAAAAYAAAYAAQRSAAVIICPEANEFPAVRLQGGNLPSFRAEAGDVYVWPIDLAWTMAFTHEESLDLGPFFARREWMIPGSYRVAGRRGRRV
jgi:hypothetical protein